MRYIKSFQLFEADDPSENEDDVQITKTEEDPKLDPQNTKTEDTSVKNIENQLKDFNAKKSLIDNAYKSSPDDQTLKANVEKILGKDPKKRNEYLVQYEQLAKDERAQIQLQKQVVNDTASIAKYNKELQRLNDLLRMEQDIKNQSSLKDSIKKTTDAIKQFNQNIANNNKNIPKLKQSILGKKPFIDSIKAKILQITNMKNKK